jgi:hypothetical protein
LVDFDWLGAWKIERLGHDRSRVGRARELLENLRLVDSVEKFV